MANQGPAAGPFIRGYRVGDFENMAKICRETLPPSLARSAGATRLAPYLWTHQYTHLSPSTCVVLDDGNGNAVGYAIGCPSVKSFVAQYQKYVDEILVSHPVAKTEITKPSDEKRAPWLDEDGEVNPLALSQLAFNGPWLLLGSEEDITLSEGWPGTFHVDILAEYQGQGWGSKIVREVLGKIESEQRVAGIGVGVHIGIARENRGVVRFYEGLGLRVWGEGEGVVWMVWEAGGED